jgi:sodium-dependent dicarboxylate transporter 2/3/5
MEHSPPFTPAKSSANRSRSSALELPVGTRPNAIVFGTAAGAVTIAQMARGGFVLNMVGILLITGFCYLLGGIALGLKF